MNYLSSSLLAMTEINADALHKELQDKETFVLNIVVDWCPDCNDRQLSNLLVFETIVTAPRPNGRGF